MERWLITGASGQLGAWLINRLSQDIAPKRILGLVRREVGETFGHATRIAELTDFDSLRAITADFKPTHVIHTAAMTSAADCYRNPDLATRINTDATAALAESAAALNARFIFISTDMVFAGDRAPYHESDQTNPLSHYGRTKAAAEQRLANLRHTAIVRLPLMYGFPAIPRTTTFQNQIEALKQRKPLRLFADEFRTPIWLRDTAAGVIAVARDTFTGTIHLAGPERLSRFEMVERFAAHLHIDNPQLESVSRTTATDPEPRPADLSLDYKFFIQRFPHLQPNAISAAAFAQR